MAGETLACHNFDVLRYARIETERTIGPANTDVIGQHVQSVYCAVPLEERLAVALSWRPVFLASQGMIFRCYEAPGTTGDPNLTTVVPPTGFGMVPT